VCSAQSSDTSSAGGSGRTALTLAGNNVERSVNKQMLGDRVSVRLDNGSSRQFEQPRLDGLRVGDRVRVEGQPLHRG